MSKKRTNVVIVMVDNQSAQTLGCYGNGEVYTPHLDRLSSEGMRFDNAYCPNALCSPGRASALTGLMPSQHGVHSWLDDRSVSQWGAGWNAISEFHTLPQVLHDAGYYTGLIGKYHLGVPQVAHHGFDHWVALARGHTLSFYDSPVVKNGQEFTQPGHSVDFLTDEALAFIEARGRQPEQPFFLLLTYNGPYGHWPAVQGRPTNRFAALYDSCPMASVPREGLSQAAIDYVNLQREHGLKGRGGPDYHALLKAPNDLDSLRNYYSQISMVDDGVGRMMGALQTAGMDENTLVIYTADHGFSLGHNGFWGHGVATWPANAHQAAYRIPMLWRHPGEIAAATRCDHLMGSIDLYASLMDYLELAQAPRNPASPSRSIVPLLQGRVVEWEDAIFIDQEETRAMRTTDWLYLRRCGGSEQYPLCDELYDLTRDADERHNVIAEHSAIAAGLAQRMYNYFSVCASPRHDLWRGGAPKSNTSRPWLWRDLWGEHWRPIVA